MLDPIAEMLTRIRNAQRAGHPSVLFSASKLKRSLVDILLKEGFLHDVEEEKTESGHLNLRVYLKYTTLSQTEKTPAIQELERVSKEGVRIYVKRGEIEKVKNGFGISILSTSKGMMTGKDAMAHGLGGEYICKVW